MKAKPINVLIVDDHDMLREGLASFLRAFPDLKMVGEASNGNEAIRLCRELKPDVALIDLIMPEVDGTTAIKVIHEENPNIHIIALSSFNDGTLVKEALRAGATGYLLKNVMASRLAEAIRATHAGLPILSPEIAQTILHKIETPESRNNDKLSDRETEVLNLIISGLSNAEIGQQLNISTNTVKNHVSNILAKMNAASRTEAVSMALQKSK
jgi:NarL family two-component system response regulator LiaR